MATNKHATIRYHALDKCFSNIGRRYFIDDLIEACNDALYDYTGLTDGIKRRQIFEDIKFMESDQGWSIPLDKHKDGKKTYYRYSDRNYSIKKQAINESEAKQLNETLSILTRFKGMPQFEWMEDLLVRVESVFNLKGNNEVIVGFEQNPYLKGLHYFTELFNAIQYKKVLEVTYQGYKQTSPVNIILHPYYLKQYNSRWFLFGLNEVYKGISNLALDRIIAIKDKNTEYIKNESINFEEYFEDVVGVSVSENSEPEKIILEINQNLWSYIESKPIHGSQKVIARNTETITIELFVQLNFEITSLLFSYGADLKIIEPKTLILNIKEKIKAMEQKYL